MELIRPSTQEIISLKVLRETYKNVCFPRDLAGADLSNYDAAVVIRDPMPDYNSATEVAEYSEPTLINGVWRRVASVVAKPEPEITTITMRQCRLELDARGLLDDVEAAIAQQPKASQIEWEYATQVNKSSDLVNFMAQSFGYDQAQLDGFFVEASKR